jgi:hypothetical protein
MLDWTTSFLSDALIIKPVNAICQTLSPAIQPMVIAVEQDYNRWISLERRASRSFVEIPFVEAEPPRPLLDLGRRGYNSH